MHLVEAVNLLLFLLGAFLIPLGTGRIGLPAAVGEILYGIIMGPQIAGLIQPHPFTSLLSELGFCFLMFLAGLELDFPHIERAGRRNLLLGCATAGLIFVVALVEALILQQPTFLMLVFAATSVGIVLVTLSEMGLSKTRAGQATIFVGSVGEFLTIILLTAMGFHARLGMSWHLLAEMGKLAALFAAAYVVLVLLRTLIWWRPESFSRVVAGQDPSEVGVRAGLALMLGFVALAVSLGVEAILGAFLAGALFSFVFREKGLLETKLSSIGFGFLMPFFFIWVGVTFDVIAVMSSGVLIGVVILFFCSVLAKLLPSLLLSLAGLSLKEVVGMGLLLSTPLTLLVAISRIGVEAGIFQQTTASAVILLAVVTAVLLPWAFRLVQRR